MVNQCLRPLPSRHPVGACRTARNRPVVPCAVQYTPCPQNPLPNAAAGWHVQQPSSHQHHAGRTVRTAAAEAGQAELSTADLADIYRQGADRLQQFCDAFPELSEDALGSLLTINPGLTAEEPQQVRARLEGLSAALSVPLARVAKLAAKLPAVLSLPGEEVAGRVRAMASELGVPCEVQLDLFVSQPAMWQVSQPSIVRDRVEALATRLGVPLLTAAQMIGRQALLLSINPPNITTTVQQVADRLGLTFEEATDFVVMMPVVLALEAKLVKLSVSGVASSTGVPVASLLGLLSRSLGLVALPTELLAASLDALAGDLGVRQEDVVGLMASQPTLLCTQPTTVQAALDTLCSALSVDRPAALRILCAQPALLYDTTTATLAGRLEALSETFNLGGPAAAAAAAAAQPALLVVAPATLRSATSLLASQLGSNLAGCWELLMEDPGAFAMSSFQDSLVDAWCARLGLDQDTVSQLLSEQPALLDMTPNTVKARLESLVALFQAPLEIVASLVLKHPALLAVPPNATITRAKNLSGGLRLSMAGAAALLAKEPGVLGVAASHLAELRPHVDAVLDVGAAYEYYTMEWVQRQMKEAQPARMTSFATMH